MNKIITLTLSFLFLIGIVFSQKKSDIIIEIEKEKITYGEFEETYKRNNSDLKNNKEELEKYLNLYVKFKMKIKEAENLGMNKKKAFVNELNKYLVQLKQPYLIDQIYNENLIKEAYNRMLKDVEVKHILIKIKYNDTLTSYNKIKKIRQKIIDGADFGKLAKEKSEDPSAKKNGGYLGYFTVFKMVYPFETLAYETPAGEISKIGRSRYGYHILKIINKREALGSAGASHILILNSKDEIQDEKKIKEIYSKLEKGKEFKILAKKYSQDKGSVKKGGNLGNFFVGMMIPKFEEEILKLKEGEYSKPFKTKYGWHIAKLNRRTKIGTFEKEKIFIKGQLKEDNRSKKSRVHLIKKLKKEYSVKIIEKAKKEFLNSFNKLEFEKNKWNIPEKLNKNLFVINDRKYGKQKITYTQLDFSRYLNKKQKGKHIVKIEGSKKQFINKHLTEFLNKKIIQYESEILDKKYPPYKKLSKEYRDGILLFNIMDSMVWTKAVKDTVGLKNFYEKTKNKYNWKKRANTIMYFCDTKEIALELKKLLKKNITDKEIKKKLLKENPLAIEIFEKRLEKGENEMLDKIKWKKGFSEIIKKDNKFYIIKIKKILPPMQKKIKEIKGLLIAKYQEYLEDEWMKKLKSKYKYKINRNILK